MPFMLPVVTEATDSDHDYESVEDIVRIAQENIIHY